MQQALVEGQSDRGKDRHGEIENWNDLDKGSEQQANDRQRHPEQRKRRAHIGEITDDLLRDLAVSQDHAEKGGGRNDGENDRCDRRRFFERKAQRCEGQFPVDEKSHHDRPNASNCC